MRLIVLEQQRFEKFSFFSDHPVYLLSCLAGERGNGPSFIFFLGGVESSLSILIMTHMRSQLNPDAHRTIIMSLCQQE